MNANKQDAGGEVTNPDNVGGQKPLIPAREFGADLTPYPEKWKQGDVNPPYKFQHAHDLWNAWQKAHAAALLRKRQQGADEGRSRAYDQVDRFLRNNLGDEAYAEYSEALEVACGYAASQGQEGGTDG